MYRTTWKYIALLFFIPLLFGCNKDNKTFSAPYEEGLPPLDIEINPTDKMQPESGKTGAETVMRIKGLDKYKDKAVIRFNGEKAEVVELTADHVKLKVPPFASTGVLSVTIDDIVFLVRSLPCWGMLLWMLHFKSGWVQTIRFRMCSFWRMAK
ncbi:DUF5008 domain-containing protein [Sphingobacterium sp. E70]|uniref:DUF5008 domain-containing protein n=1 Tax=Sphingobacterium sp. E70 TaxID=2853439 RepID=UPI00211C9205|nr:DUF5008 domain-containing protein [Sphingobacterium sp. E70]ULT28006.1 DUF5008 domain-containing protein [Sphingobacterium sp. E70]